MTQFMLNVVEISLSMAAVISVILILAQAVGKKFTAKSRYIIWMIILVRLAVPFNTGLVPSLFEFNFSDEAEASVTTAVTETTAIDGYYTAVAEVMTVSPVEAVSETNYTGVYPEYSANIPMAESVTENKTSAVSAFSYEMILKVLTYVYIIGAAAFFIWKIIAYLAYTEMIKRLRLDVSDQVYDVYNRICNDMNITKKPEIFVSSYVKSPLLYGFFKPCVVLSDELTDTASLSAVLAHELTHYVRRDLWLKLISLIAVSLHWFNPLVHICAKKFEFEMELSCDEKVLSGFDDDSRVAYGIVVLDIVKRCEKASGSLTTHFNTGSSVLKRRIVNIIDTSEKSKGRIIMISVLVICIFMGSAVAFRLGNGNLGGEKADLVDTEETSAESVSEVLSLYSYTVYGFDASHNYIPSGNPNNSFSIENNGYINVKVGDVSSDFEIENPDSGTVFKDIGAFISENFTLIAVPNGNKLDIYISSDSGETWSRGESIQCSDENIATPLISFCDDINGYILINAGTRADRSNEIRRIYKTSDAGLTWSEVSANIDKINISDISGFGFSDENTGFVSFRATSSDDNIISVYKTEDGGASWSECDEIINLEYSKISPYYPSSPVFDQKGNGYIAVYQEQSSSYYNYSTPVIYMTTNDNGNTWLQSTMPYNHSVSITSLDEWNILNSDGYYSENCYNLFYNLLSGESEFPEYNSVIINDWKITRENSDPNTYWLIFDFTVESSSLDTLPEGTYHKRVLDIVDCIMEDVEELAPAYEFGDIEEARMVRNWISSIYIWDCPTFGEYNSYNGLVNYLCNYYSGNRYELEVSEFMRLAEEKFGVKNADTSDIQGFMFEDENGIMHIQSGALGGGANYSIVGCEKTGDITTVTVQFYADCNSLLKSYKIAYKIKDTGIWLGYEMLEDSSYEPYGLRSYFGGDAKHVVTEPQLEASTEDSSEDIISIDSLYRWSEIAEYTYESYPIFLTALLESGEYTSYLSGIDPEYGSAFAETMKNVKFGDYTIRVQDFNGDSTIILDIEVLGSDVELFPVGKNTYRISDGYIPMIIAPIDKETSGYKFADTPAQNALKLWFGTCRGYQLPKFGELPGDDMYTAYKDNKGTPEEFYMTDIGEYIIFTYGRDTGLSAEEMQYYAKKCFGVDYTKYYDIIFEQDGMYSVGGHGGESWSLTALGEVQKDNKITVTVQFYADYSKLVKSHLMEYNFTQLEDGTLVFNGSEVIEKASVSPVHLSV